MVKVSIMLLNPGSGTRKQYAWYEDDEANLSEIMKDLKANQCEVRSVRYAKTDYGDLFEVEVV